MEVMLRPFLDQDAAAVLAIANAAVPYDREGNELWMRLRRQFDAIRFQRRHYVALERETQQIIGYGAIEQGQPQPRFRLFLLATSEWLHAGVGAALYKRLMGDLHALGAGIVWMREHQQHHDLLSFMRQSGFVQTQLLWDARLTLAQAQLAPLLPVVEQVAARGIVIDTVMEERRRDPHLVQHLHELYNVAQSDIYQPIGFETFVQRLEQPGIMPQGFFLARQGDEYLGLSVLARMDAAPEQAVQYWTGVRPLFRRQGIATALRICTIEAAQRLGYQTLVTYTDHADPIMLALNEKLGFHRWFGYVTLEKTLEGDNGYNHSAFSFAQFQTFSA
jgi:mycothiol synthase